MKWSKLQVLLVTLLGFGPILLLSLRIDEVLSIVEVPGEEDTLGAVGVTGIGSTIGANVFIGGAGIALYEDSFLA